MHTTDTTSLTVRRLHIDLSQGFARHWCGGDAFMTAYCNALSMSFPLGEQFFIDAVKAGVKALPEGPEHERLRREAQHFVGQEATHRHLHTLYNAQLEKQGLVNHWGPRITQRLHLLRTRHLAGSDRPHLHELAITAAFEHYTAILGDLLLEQTDQPGDWLRDAQEPLKTLWRWHAAEESEHKCIAFDLYQALGGSHSWRVRWFKLVSLYFFTDVVRQTVNNLWHDRTLHKPGTWWSALKFVFGKHGLLRRAGQPVLAYLKKDFHPLKVGQVHLSQRWLAEHQDRWSAVGRPEPQAGPKALSPVPSLRAAGPSFGWEKPPQA